MLQVAFCTEPPVFYCKRDKTNATKETFEKEMNINHWVSLCCKIFHLGCLQKSILTRNIKMEKGKGHEETPWLGNESTNSCCLISQENI